MAATLNFAYKDSTTGGSANGYTGYTTLSTTLRFKAADTNSGTATDDPMVRPASGTVYSYWKNLRARVTVKPATALLALRFKISAAPTISGGDNGINLGYSFIRVEDYTANVAAVVPQRLGANPTSDQNWTDNRTIAAGTGGTAVANHTDTTNDNVFWGGDTGSDMLLLGMEVSGGGSYTNGGSIQPFNLIASYNEI